APIASTVRTALRAITLCSTRGRITNDSSNQPMSNPAFTTTARVLMTPERTALGCTASITSIPPKRMTCGTASTAIERRDRDCDCDLVSSIAAAEYVDAGAEELECRGALVVDGRQRGIRQARPRERGVVPELVAPHGLVPMRHVQVGVGVLRVAGRRAEGPARPGRFVADIDARVEVLGPALRAA